MEKPAIPQTLLDLANDYFDDQQQTESWFNTENIELGLVTPISLCDSAKGVEQVSTLLEKLNADK
ncbi:DUF2384 domain-containing protein [Photobacterium sanctipauli]|uniref:DUF2384 domain-containing protein n=1 Tax=Photobacterium sanctipauli TaxID=1342794 RepID=A0A2T3P0Y0_9GAMM|nr:MbcA/ParS/Xre antitoxin family protein [Photobacterium sanctipauli]PSW22129.1 DUF2384 domain-containing protein [Photobacterium sanctipauli]